MGTFLLLNSRHFSNTSSRKPFKIFVIFFSIELMEDFPSLAVDLRDEPTTVLQTLGLAVSQVLYKHVLYYFYLHILQVISVYVKVGSRGE